MDCLQKCWSKTIMVQAWWTSSNYFKGWYPPKDIIMSVWWDWKGVVYFLSCFQGTKRLIRMFAVNNWTNWMQQTTRNGQNWLIVNVSYYIITTPDHTYLWWLRKNWESLAGKFWCIHYIVLILHHQTTIYFDLFRTPYMIKLSAMMRL